MYLLSAGWDGQDIKESRFAPHRAMTTPAQFQLLLRRLAAMRVPKAAILSMCEGDQFGSVGKRSMWQAFCLQELFLCVLLTSFLNYVDLKPEQPYDLIEFFAGYAALARETQNQGFTSTALDLDFDSQRRPSRRFRVDKRSPFDLNSDSGFA